MGMTKVKWMGVCLDDLGVFWKLKWHIGVKVAKEDQKVTKIKEGTFKV